MATTTLPNRLVQQHQSRSSSTDSRNELRLRGDHYIGIDVGTGSARACIINDHGDIVGLASENIGLWQPEHGFYEQSTTDIWRCICNSVQKAMAQQNVDATSIKGIGFDATCSLAVFTYDTDEPVSVTGPKFAGNDHNVVLWLDHRPVEETKKINATRHNLLRYVGGTMSIEMEIPKVLWLKNHMPKELFGRCKFYDLADALTHLATGNEKRSFCSVVCKQGYVPVGVDGSVKGWQEDFLKEIGLEELTEDNLIRMGGVDGVVSLFHNFFSCLCCSQADNLSRTGTTSRLASLPARSPRKPVKNWGCPRELRWVAALSMLTQAGSAQWAPRSSFPNMSLTQSTHPAINHKRSPALPQ
jgi:FGGY-family pentulose kinase